MTQKANGPTGGEATVLLGGEQLPSTGTRTEAQSETPRFFGKPFVHQLDNGMHWVGFRGPVPCGLANEHGRQFRQIASAERHRHYLHLQMEVRRLKGELHTVRKDRNRLLARVAQLLANGRE